MIDCYPAMAHTVFHGLDGPAVVAHDCVVIEASAREPVCGQGGGQGERLLATYEAVKTVVAEAGEPLVQHHTQTHQRTRLSLSLVEWHEKGHGTYQALVEPNVEVAFVARLPRKAETQVLDVPEAAVYELGAAPRGPPPPMIRRSNGSPESFRNSSSRDCLLKDSSPILRLLGPPHAWRGDKHVVDPVPTGFHGRAQAVEPTVVDQGSVHLGLVVVGFVAHVPARERISLWGEGIGQQKAILAQVLPNPAKVVEHLGLGQPARKADEKHHNVGSLLFESAAHLAVG